MVGFCFCTQRYILCIFYFMTKKKKSNFIQKSYPQFQHFFAMIVNILRREKNKIIENLVC